MYYCPDHELPEATRKNLKKQAEELQEQIEALEEWEDRAILKLYRDADNVEA